ncbi:SDR family oxidoreductase [Rhizobium alvei]|uniref:SDR family oxidoreductase n=1 Tax=Rhizobium alvei TaxID=1132659 RepID=A0ABT8YPD2_9HYPH|nr:SDR family oxidoreductase [Rhizobium alvei]MDO6965595.1 SDR family oxidoreductase [Rhizobium alvei]
MTLTILGAGFSGKAIGRICAPGFSRIAGTTRSQAKFPTLAAAGLEPFEFDGLVITPELKAVLGETTHLVQSIAPREDGDPFLRLISDLRSVMPKLKWVGYLSTIGVYGNRDGAWTDETSEPTPLSRRSRERVDAEQDWLARGAAAGIPVAVLRLSGIYGPGRNPLLNLEKGTARRIVKKDQVFNRIRCEDIGRATSFLIERNMGGIYNVTDSHPSPSQDVVEFAARLMGVPVPPDIAFETADLSPMARSFYGENKRVSNRKLRDLGFEFDYPDYEKSIRQMWEEKAWRGVDGDKGE